MSKQDVAIWESACSRIDDDNINNIKIWEEAEKNLHSPFLKLKAKLNRANYLWIMQMQKDAIQLVKEVLFEDPDILYGFKLLAEWFIELKDWRRAAAAYYRAKSMPIFRNAVIPDIIWLDKGPESSLIRIDSCITEKHDMSLEELFTINIESHARARIYTPIFGMNARYAFLSSIRSIW